MYETQLLKIKIRPGKTEQVVQFLRSLQERESQSLEALRREGMVVESMFLERHPDGDTLYYYVKARSLMHANEVNMQATDSLTLEIRKFVSDTWGHIVSPEPLFDLDLIKEAAEGETIKPASVRRKIKSTPASSPTQHAIAG
jgi:Family of unknown function (DUF6176)